MIGTTVIEEEHAEPTEGYIRIFDLESQQWLSKKKVEGAVFGLAQIGERIVAAVGSSVLVFE